MAEPERIEIQVSDEELDAALAKIEEALEKKEELLELPELPELPEGVEKIEDVAGIRAFLEETKEKTDEVLAEEEKIKGLSMATRRIISRLPFVREAHYLVRQIQMMLRVSPEVAALLVAVHVIGTLVNLQRRMEERERAYEAMIRRERGITHADFLKWQEEQERAKQELYKEG